MRRLRINSSGLITGLLVAGSILVPTIPSTAEDAAQRQPQSLMRRVVQPDPHMPASQRMDFELGAGLFKRNWVAAPSSTQAVDGLGPLYNARSCNACHPGGQRPNMLVDKRGTVIAGLTVHLGQAAAPGEVAKSDPVYGEQIQTQALPGQKPEARVDITMIDGPLVALAGGENVQLKRPQPALSNLGYGPLAAEAKAGLRLAPAIHGLGLLDRIPASEILAQAQVVKPDGIAGRPNWVVDVRSGKREIGRFGWKAVQPSLAQQNAHAFSIDIGMSTTLFPAPGGDCTAAQMACLAAPNGNSPQYDNVEIAEALRHLVDVFVANAMLPSANNVTTNNMPAVKRQAGEQLFAAAGCTGCHRPGYDLPAAGTAPARHISPYSDLLLHDMGPDLADGVPEGEAGGSEWRTAPLWGLGHTVAGDGPATLLHDGRAGTILEAILWHGGEARAARQRVVAMTPTERSDLIAFLRSL